MSYVNLGNNTFRFTITIYRDCRPPSLGGGNPQALLSDDPLFVSIFDGNGTFWRLDSANAKIQGGQIVQEPSINSPCANINPIRCNNKIVYEFTKTLPSNNLGHYIVCQRCCFSENFTNIQTSESTGLNLMTFIPPSTPNNSATFNQDAIELKCLNSSNKIDFSATDMDGDSLSYSLCQLYQGGSRQNPKPILTIGPPYPAIQYHNGYSYQKPFGFTNSSVSLDSTTGQLSINSNTQGNYIIGICCTEWRNGIAIQENIRTAVVSLLNCKLGLDVETSNNRSTPFDCPIQVSANGADFYKWEITSFQNPNQQTIFFNNDSIQNPVILFNRNALVKSGEFNIRVIGSSNSGCLGIDSFRLIVTNGTQFFIPNAFSPNGDGLNDELGIFTSGHQFEFIRIYNRWGNKVFESNSIENKWDGNFEGKEALADTYFWVARFRDKQGNRITKKGSVLIVR